MTDLLLCPFCGSRAVFGQITDPEDDNFGGEFVSCSGCIVTTDLRFSVKEDARPLLAEAWNRRAERERILTLLREPSEELVEAAGGAAFNVMRFRNPPSSEIARAVLSAIAAKLGGEG